MARRIPVSISLGEGQREALNTLLDAIKSEEISDRSKLMQAIANHAYMPIPWNDAVQGAFLTAICQLVPHSPEDAKILLGAVAALPWRSPAASRITALKRLLLKEEDGGHLESPTWFVEALQLATLNQPFLLKYNGKERTVRYAEIAYRDGKEYLHAWITEANPRAELPDLEHNRLFSAETSHLEEVPTLVPLPDHLWREEGLDSVDVTFMVTFPYKAKPEDVRAVRMSSSSELDVWQVTRRVTNMLWFLQSIARYGDRCIIQSPESVRQLYVEQLRRQLASYD